MSEVKFKNSRFDPDQTSFQSIAKEMAKAFGYSADLHVSKEIAQLLRLRVAQKNECAYCIILHSKTAREIGVLGEKVDNISSWWNSDLYTNKEKIALEYADVLTDGTTHHFQRFHDAMLEVFSEVEIAEIAAIVINMNVWTRLKLAQGAIPYL